MDDTLLFRLDVAPARRVIALVFMMLLSVILIYTAINSPLGFGVRGFLLAIGVVTLLGARALARGTKASVDLREDGIYLSTGEELAHIDNIDRVEPGMFAMKPSGGISVKLKTAPGFAFVPGMYWRVGRTLGIGGVTIRGAAKAMSDGLAAYLAERDAKQSGQPD